MPSSIGALPAYFFSCFSPAPAAPSPFSDVVNLVKLEQKLVSDNNPDHWFLWKKEIKSIIQKNKHHHSELDSFIKAIMAAGIKVNPQKTLSFLMEIIDLDALTNTIKIKDKNFSNIHSWIEEHVSSCPPPKDSSWIASFMEGVKSWRPLALYFIPNLVNTFLGAFNLLDTNKRYASLWDKYLLLDIIYKFFFIPYFLIKGLENFYGITTKVYLIAAAILAFSAITISCIKKWFKPNTFIFAENLDIAMEQGKIKPAVGQFKEIQQLKAALELDSGSTVLLVGESGSGKTTLIENLVQEKHRGKLSENLERLTPYKISCGSMFAVDFGFAQVVNEMKTQIAQMEGKKLLLFFDEFNQIVKNDANAFRSFKEFLKENTGVNIVLAMTRNELQKLNESDKDDDQSFKRMFTKVIEIPSASRQQVRLVAQNHIERLARGILVRKEAIDKIVDYSLDENFFPGIGAPAKAKKILEAAIGTCWSVLKSPHFVTEDLNSAYEKLEILNSQAAFAGKPDTQLESEIRNQKTEIKTLEETSSILNRQIDKIRKIIAHEQMMVAGYRRITHDVYKKMVGRLKQSDERKVDFEKLSRQSLDIVNVHQANKKQATSLPVIQPKDQICYLLYYFYGIDAMRELMQREINKLDNKVPVQCDGQLIDRVFEELKNGESKYYKKPVSVIKGSDGGKKGS